MLSFAEPGHRGSGGQGCILVELLQRGCPLAAVAVNWSQKQHLKAATRRLLGSTLTPRWPGCTPASAATSLARSPLSSRGPGLSLRRLYVVLSIILLHVSVLSILSH